MSRIKELEKQIEKLKLKLRNYLDDNKSKNEIYELSIQIDDLIVEYSNLAKK